VPFLLVLSHSTNSLSRCTLLPPDKRPSDVLESLVRAQPTDHDPSNDTNLDLRVYRIAVTNPQALIRTWATLPCEDRDLATDNTSSDWVHDRFEEDRHDRRRGGRDLEHDDDRAPYQRGAPEACVQELPTSQINELTPTSEGTRIRVENIHYDIAENDIKVYSSIHQVLQYVSNTACLSRNYSNASDL
jgi:hypothetical protein